MCAVFKSGNYKAEQFIHMLEQVVSYCFGGAFKSDLH